MTFTCTVCQETFLDDNELYQHKLKTWHDCNHCGYKFKERYDVRLHMRTHKLHNCTKCQRGFFLTRALQQHMLNSTHSTTARRKKRRADLISLSPGELQYSKPTFITELERFDNIERYMEEVVFPDRDNVENCKKVVADVVDFLQHRTKYSVAEVFEGGSLAKGTGIKLKNDIDLALFLNDISISQLKRHMKGRLTYLKDHLLKGSNFGEKLEFTDRQFTGHSIQFKLKCSPTDVAHDVDLLPAVDVLEEYGSTESVYQTMRRETTKMRSFYSVCLGKLQVDFVKHRPERVKRLIRLVKHWKSTQGFHQLKSYSIELIVIKMWQKWGEPEQFDLKDRFKDVLKEIANLGKIKIEWPECYNIEDYGGLPNDEIIIMDPANPFGNTAKMLNYEKKKIIRDIEKTARETMIHL